MRGSRQRDNTFLEVSKRLESSAQLFCYLPFSSPQDWYIRLVKSQCWTRSDSALLEGAELVNRLPPGDMSAFMMNSVWRREREARETLSFFCCFPV